MFDLNVQNHSVEEWICFSQRNQIEPKENAYAMEKKKGVERKDFMTVAVCFVKHVISVYASIRRNTKLYVRTSRVVCPPPVERRRRPREHRSFLFNFCNPWQNWTPSFGILRNKFTTISIIRKILCNWFSIDFIIKSWAFFRKYYYISIINIINIIIIIFLQVIIDFKYYWNLSTKRNWFSVIRLWN